MAKDKGVFLKPLVRSEMTNYQDGYGNSRDWKKYNKNLNVAKLQIQPNPFLGTLTFRALVKSEHPRDEKNSKGTMNKTYKKGALKHIQYLVTIRFQNMKFVDAETKQFNQKWNVGGREQWSRKAGISTTKAMLKCQCRDFLATWEWQLADGGGLWPNNRATKYTRKTKYNPQLPPHPVSNPPPRNPKDKMGYCKHIQTFLQYLYDEDLIQNK